MLVRDAWKGLFPRSWQGLEDLPPGLLAAIVNRLEPEDLPRVRQVCRSLRTAVNHSTTRAAITTEPEQSEKWWLSFPFLTSLTIHHAGSSRLPVPRLNSALRRLEHLTDVELDSGSGHRLPGLVLPQQVTSLRLRAFNSPDADVAAAQVGHLRRLCFDDCRELRWEVLQSAVARHGNCLTELTLRNADFAPARQNAANVLALTLYWRALNPQRLETLTLCGLRSGGHGLRPVAVSHLAACTSLTSLDLSSNPWLNSTGVSQLVALTQLTRLDLSGTMVSEAGVRQLTGLTQLADLGTGGVRGSQGGLLGPTFFSALAGLPLTRLDISGCMLTDANRCFAALSRLVVLKAVDSNLLEQSAALGGLSRLQTLSVQHCLERSPRLDPTAPSHFRAGIQLGYLTGLVGLTSLDLARPAQTSQHTRMITLSQADLAALARLTALQHLCLSGEYSVDAPGALAALAPLTLLTRLDMQCVRWRSSMQQLEPLQHLPALRVLRVDAEVVQQKQVGWLPSQLRRAMHAGSRLRS